MGIYLAHDEPFFVVPPEKWSTPDLLRTAAEVLSPRWMLWQRRVLDPAVVRAIEEEDDVQARDRRGGPSPDDEPPLLRLVLREVQGPRTRREDLPGTLAAADRVRGAGAARSASRSRRSGLQGRGPTGTHSL